MIDDLAAELLEVQSLELCVGNAAKGRAHGRGRLGTVAVTDELDHHLAWFHAIAENLKQFAAVGGLDVLPDGFVAHRLKHLGNQIARGPKFAG